MLDALPTAFLFILAALILPLLPRGPARGVLLLAVPALAAVQVFTLPFGNLVPAEFFGFPLELMRVDKLARVFALIFCIAAFLGNLYAWHVRDTVQQVAALLYAGAAIGAVFAGDLITLFFYWEGTAITSVFLIWARRTTGAYYTGMRYLIIQIGSGVILLAGVILLYAETGNIAFERMVLGSPATWLIFVAFGIKCAFPLLHNWLQDGYPAATVTGTVILSAFTTKLAVYALARGFAGTEILIYIGAIMTLFPIFYAVIENDLRRVLAYSLINQLGFMVVGIGIGTELALNGAVAHAFNDVIFKGLLMMSMGAVLHVTGEMRGSELGGLYKKMPRTTILCMVGAASISAFPLFSGFVSKSMVVSAAIQEGHPIVWLMLLFASAGVFHHAGIKIPFFAFFAHESKHVANAHEPPTNMLIAMTMAAVLCIGVGSFPGLLYGLLPYDTGYSPYDVSHVLAQLQLLAFSALAFTWLKLAHIYPPELKSVNLDAEWLYRRVLPEAVRRLLAKLAPFDRALRQLGKSMVQRALLGLARHHGEYGVLAQTWPTGSMVTWVAALLGLSLLLYYL